MRVTNVILSLVLIWLLFVAFAPHRTTVEVEGDSIVVRVHGADVLWAMRRRIVVPVDHVAGAWPLASGPRPPRLRWPAPGVRLPYVITAGTYRGSGQRQFWNVRIERNAIVIALGDEKLSYIVVEPRDPARALAEITRALRET